MGWENRDYNRGQEAGAEYFGNPALFLDLSVPFGRWLGGVRVRLHFWLLLAILFAYFGYNLPRPIDVTVAVTVVIQVIIAHEYGHRLIAQWLGGSHDMFLLWPAGGMIPPQAPPTPGATFATHGGGILVNVLLAIGAWAGLKAYHFPIGIEISPAAFLASFGLERIVPPFSFAGAPIPFILYAIFYTCVGLIPINILPFYVFDGGYLWQAILWKWLGLFRAINITCIAGMCVAVPFLLWSLHLENFLGIVFWILLFASSFSKRRELHASGTNELDDSIALSAQDRGDNTPPARRKLMRWPSRSAVKQAAKQAANLVKEQEQIDAILDKVHKQGMQSLTWREKRALQKATERQRERGGAPRR